MGTRDDAKDPPWQPPSLLPSTSPGSAAFSLGSLAHRGASLSPVAGLVSNSGLILNSSPPRFGESGSSFPACVESDPTPSVGPGSQSVRNLDAIVDKLPSSISSDADQGVRVRTEGTESSGVDVPSLTVVSLQGEVKLLPAAWATGDFVGGMAGHLTLLHKGSLVVGEVVQEDATEAVDTRMVQDLEDGELEEGQLLGDWNSEDVAKSPHSDVLDCNPSSPEYTAECSGQEQREDHPGLMDEPGVSEDVSKVYVRRKRMSPGPSGGDASLSWQSSGQGENSSAKVKGSKKTRRSHKNKTLSSKQTVTNKIKEPSNREPETFKAASMVRKLALKTDTPKSKLEDTKDDGPEEGEVLPEKGILSALIEDEVGLWTTDVADEEIEQVNEPHDGKGKRGNGPQRKVTKKATYRKKRAEKERQLGLRPSKRVKLSEPPPPPPRKLCTFFLKGRCAKGKDCSFSHDCIPLTKSEPCKFLTMGCCLKGHDCPFSHDLALFPCKYFHTRGYCYDAENCRFSHGPISEEERKKLVKRLDQESKDRLQTKDRAADAQFEGIATGGLDLPPGYGSLGTQDMSSSPMVVDEGPYLPTHTSGAFEPGTSNIPPFTEAQQAQVASCDEGSRPVLSNPEKIQSANLGRITPFQDKKPEPTESTPIVDQKEGENFVLLAARKAAAAAVAAGQQSELYSRGLTKPALNSSLRRSRGLEGSAMELLKATMSKEEAPITQNKDGSKSVTTNAAGGSKMSSAMALLEGILKGD